MRKTFTIPRLDRVVAVLDGSAELKNPFDVQNLRLQGYDYWMRYGYTTIQAKQTNFVGALLQSGIVELVKDEEGNIVYKINKVVLVDESVQQD